MTIIDNSDTQLTKHLPRSIIAKQPKWLSKDRKWNFIFASIMTLGMFIAFLIKELGTISSIMFWLTLIGTPLFVRYFNKVTFIEGKKFLTSEAREINVNTDFPSWFIIVTFAVVAVLYFFLSKNAYNLSMTLCIFILASALFFIPALCFSLKNCPISILFNLKFWKLEGNLHNMPYSSYTPPRDNYSDRRTNPAYSFQPNNIYYRPHRY